jgi:tetratricopeptide (TPR) repeat protein
MVRRLRIAWLGLSLLLGGFLLYLPHLTAQDSSTLSNQVIIERRNGTVDIADFKVKKEALAEFRKGDDLVRQQKWADAVTHYRRAIAIDDQFVEAYNNLGFAYARLGDRVNQREVLEKAIALNRHSLQPLMNRAALALQENDHIGAENWLQRALQVDPDNPDALVLLARAQLSNGHYEAALVTARQVDARPHARYALIHYLAARALEAEKRAAEAAAELRVFLKEEPQGVRADAARKELNDLEATAILR